MTAPRIAVDNLTYTYPDGTPALCGVSLEVVPGECMAIAGANGAGKSTLLQQLNGVLTPSSGSVTIGGIAVTHATLPQIRRMVGTVFQDADDQLFMPTVFDDIAFGPLNMGLGPDEVRARVQHTLERLGIAHLRNRPPHRLSGGEKRRVAIATVLAMSPAILVLDEPSAGLDPRGRRQLIELLRSLPQTKIIATHDLEMVLDLAPRTICLNAGGVAADGDTVTLLRDTALMEACGLETPPSLV
jgi:cobalt/nickel transport system ATP-binding protein